MQGELPAPRMAHDPRLVPTERVEHATGVVHVGRHRVRPFRRRRREPSLLVPGDGVLLRELVGEIAEVVEAQPRPPVQQENRRPAAGAEASDERSIVVCREFRPRHGPDRLMGEPGPHRPGTRCIREELQRVA